MFLFPLVAIPLYTLFFANLYGLKSDDWKRLGILFLKGFCTAMPAYLLLYLVSRATAINYKPWALYFQLLLTKHLLPFGMAVAGFYFFHLLSRLDKIRLIDVFSFFTGFYTLAACYGLVLESSRYDVYLLFVLPVLHMAVIHLSSFLIEKNYYSYGIFRIGLTTALITLPFVMALVSYCCSYSRFGLAFPITLALMAVGILVWQFYRE